MGTLSENSYSLYFLSGGGEMGELIRQTDWSKTPLGDPETWSQSLRTAVGIMLNNPFGMYIAWGKEYIQIYNDGYRPILGATKHPQALGISTRETFSEVWYIIGDMFDGVMQGKAVGFPDFMLPLNRNGFVEECYFDFAYSPILKSNGKIGGILVTVIETTKNKKNQDALKESEERFKAMADNIPNLAWMADAEGSVFWYNKQWYEFTGTTPEQMKGWGWQSVHHTDTLPSVLTKWKESIVTGKSFEMVFPIKSADGGFRQFLTRVLPVFDDQGKIYQWFGTNTDITEQIETEQKLKESEEQLKESEQNLRNTIIQTPVAM
jgi:PAS domain S-box-containing protein